jgi:magnesium chelatase subunit D
MLPAELFEDSPDSGDETGVLRWADALRAAALIAVDPVGLGGVALIAQHGPVRDRWIALLRSLLPPDTPVRRVPLHVRDDRLIGGLDLTATLQSGRPVAQTGLMVEADGGLLMLAMAERVSESTAARLCAALDTGEVALARDGLSEVRPARFGIIALDERIDDERGSNDERLPERLLERLAFHLSLGDVSIGDIGLLDGDADGRGSLSGSSGSLAQAPDIAAARVRLMQVITPDDVMQAICAAALALGVDSLRGSLLALRAARASAALDARDTVSPDDASLAARLVLSPRATRLPQAPPDESDDTPPDADDTARDDQEDDQPEQTPPPEDSTENPPENPPEDPQADDDTPPEDDPDPPDPDRSLDELILEAAKASIPAGLLAKLAMNEAMASRGAAGGRAGARREGSLRGRPVGTRPGLPRDGARLALIDTLRTAAPWQTLRRREIAAAALTALQTSMQTSAQSPEPRSAPRSAPRPPSYASALGIPHRPSKIEVRASDFRVARVQERAETTTIFAVDASGSSALNRLAEAKGAVELLLADCYVRRDKVAVISFRGRSAQMLLAPTRSLVRAKRGLSGLPGGGGTPLAAGISAAAELADTIRRRGGTPVIVLLTDGRGNVALDGTGGRGRADSDARQSARRLRAAGHTALLIDTSPLPQISARELAGEMGAAYLPLPRADASAMSRSVQAATAASARNPIRGR